MEALLILLLLYLVAALVLLPIWTIIKVRAHDDLLETLLARLGYLDEENKQLRTALKELSSAAAKPVAGVVDPGAARPPAAVTARPPGAIAFETVPTNPPMVPVAFETVPTNPPIDAAAAVSPSVSGPAAPDAISASSSTPPLLPPVLTPPAPGPVTPVPPVPSPPAPKPAPVPAPAFNWEQFFGAKFFAWAGGLALFLGVAYFVKYSFDNNLIPAEVRVAIGFVLGAGLVVSGLKLAAGRFRIVAQSLVATGVVSLYAVTFACNSVYHFAFFGQLPTFLLMVLITATAFLIAVRLEAQVVAILGMLGGFLTPVLLSTGVDNPGGLFGYLALLNLGLAAVALHRSWPHLVTLGAAGTVLMMIGWADKFYAAAKTPVAMTVCLGFSALYLAVHAVAQRLGRSDRWITLPAVALPFVALGFALMFLGYPAAAARAGLFLGFVLLADAALLTLAWRDEALPKLHAVAGMAGFAVLGFWTGGHLTDELLPWALAGYLAFGAMHIAFPLLLERRQPDAAPAWWSQLVAPLTLVLLLLPLFKLDAVSFLIWPAILLVDLAAIALAAATASLLAVGIVLVLTLLATGLWIFKVPAAVVFAPSLLLVIGFFAVFFFAAGFWLVRRLGDRLPASADTGLTGVFGDARAQIPAFSSLLPFLLLIMACARLTVPDPSMIFGLALLLVGLTLGLTRIMNVEWLPACALAGVGALEFAWHGRQFDPASPAGPLGWYLGFYAVFTLFPFVFRRQFADRTGPWAVAALAGVVHFPLVYLVARRVAPDSELMGLLPALFATPPLLSLVAILRGTPADSPARLNQLAWFGGVALLFITLIFPIQFERQWLTVAWALEGAALLWLFHRVPHPGLRAVGAALLVTAFARLALNPSVLGYHPRSDTPILNWYLYSYGLVTAALFAGARLAAPPRERALGINLPPLLNTLAVILAFLLLNLEIADYFAPAGSNLIRFRFSGGLAQDTTYTIAWSLFALGLLGAGLWKRLRPARLAGITLLGVALLKLFLHDLARLDALYRIGALVGFAVIAIAASFAYQKFLPSHEPKQNG